ncbi:MAG: cytochrome b N-terminal domain-containing protein [Planctomycetaceae bacterium]|nr:cytochrome b N-terminal domain-containing protein [Planctomycetaceae bacterium]
MFQWLNDRTGAVTGLKTFWYWTVPATKCVFRMIPAMIIFAFLLQGITGVIMWSHYSPGSQTAWESVFFLQYHIPFGWLVRGIHHYSAQLIVGLLGFYLLASIFRYSYRSPREFVFWGALVLFVLSLCSCLTGDLLAWTLPGYSATLVRVRFLQMIPYAGSLLFKLVLGNPGPEFGTYTLTRFLVLHIMVFGGGFFAFLVLWRFFDFRARKIQIAQNAANAAFAAKMNAEPDASDSECKLERPKLAYFWSGQLFFTSVACMIFMAATLGLVFQHELCDKFQEKFPGKAKAEVAANAEAADQTDVPIVDWSGLPKEARRGAVLMSPASPGTAYNAARPEWSFRAVYHYSNMFPADKKFIAIFVVLPAIGFFFFLVPILGKFKPFHYLIVLATAAFVVALVYMTWASYKHDFDDPDYLIAVAEAEDLAVRATELALRPEGIPPTGALSLMQSDPKIKGRELFVRHCATCHAFVPQPGESVYPDFMPYYPPKPAEGAEPWKAKAPNLYQPIRKQWIAGFTDKERIISDDYLGGTVFRRGSMVEYVRDTLPETMEFIDEMIADDDPDDPMYTFASAKEGLDLLNEMLHKEALRDGRRAVVDKIPAGISEKRYELFSEFGCDETGCHKFYDKGSPGGAADLTGYMSREWLVGAIANIEDPRFYGAKNDGMPVYYAEGNADSTMTVQEVELIADFLRGTWYRPERSVTVAEPVMPEPAPQEPVAEKSAEAATEPVATVPDLEPPVENPTVTVEEPAVADPVEIPVPVLEPVPLLELPDEEPLTVVEPEEPAAVTKPESPDDEPDELSDLLRGLN